MMHLCRCLLSVADAVDRSIISVLTVLAETLWKDTFPFTFLSSFFCKVCSITGENWKPWRGCIIHYILHRPLADSWKEHLGCTDLIPTAVFLRKVPEYKMLSPAITSLILFRIFKWLNFFLSQFCYHKIPYQFLFSPAWYHWSWRGESGNTISGEAKASGHHLQTAVPLCVPNGLRKSAVSWGEGVQGTLSIHKL